MDLIDVSGTIKNWTLNRELKETDPDSPKSPLGKVRRVWILCAGPKFFEHTKPMKIEGTTLHIAVANGDLAGSLQKSEAKKVILENLRQHCSSVPIKGLFCSVIDWEKTVAFKHPEKDRLMLNHPSYCESGGKELEPLKTKEVTLFDAFEYWEQAIKLRQERLPQCPLCEAPTPTSEITAWGHCQMCHSTNYTAPTIPQIQERLRLEALIRPQPSEPEDDGW